MGLAGMPGVSGQTLGQLHEKLNTLLDSSKTRPLADLYAGLRRFIADHPAFERAYLTLLEQYIIHDQKNTAITYFQRLSREALYEPNSQWMLARLFRMEGSLSDAYDAYLQAIRSVDQRRPPMALLKEFVEFDVSHAEISDGRQVLEQLVSDASLLNAVAAFYHYSRYQDRQALPILTDLPSSLSHDLTVLHVLANCYVTTGQHEAADSVWQQAYRFARREKNFRAEAEFLSYLGYLKETVGTYKEAREYYAQAVEIASTIADKRQVAYIMGQLAFSEMAMGDYSEAESHFQEAIANVTPLTAKSEVADRYRGLAMTSYFLGKYQDALALIRKSENVLPQAKSRDAAIKTFFDKATIMIALKQVDLAENALLRALDIAHEGGLHDREKEAKARLGHIFRLKGRFGKARELYGELISFLEARHLKRRLYTWQRWLGACYLLERDYHKARIEYLKALKASRDARARTSEGWTLLRLGDVELALDSLSSALSYYELALQTALELQNTEMLWEIYLGYGNACRRQNQSQKAIASYKKAARIMEKTRDKIQVSQLRQGYFVDGFMVYQNLVNCYLDSYERNHQRTALDSLFYFYQLGRSRVLKEARQRTALPSHSRAYLQAREQLRIVQRRVREQKERYVPDGELIDLLTELEAARYTLEAQKLRAFAADSSARARQAIRIPTLEGVLAYLEQADLGYVQYHISEERSFALVAYDGQAELVLLQLEVSELARDIDALLGPLHNVKEGQLDSVVFRADMAHKLYQSLVEPVVAQFTLPEKILVVPDFALMKLPFEMLLQEAPEKPRYTPLDVPSYKDKFFGLEHAIAYSPGAFLETESGRTPSRPRVLAVASPEGTITGFTRKAALRFSVPWSFEPLEYAKREAVAIRSLHPNTTILARNLATKANLRAHAPETQILHFATHAFSDTVFSDFSGLILTASEDSTDDGILMGYEIPDYELDCELVTLSACETGRGQVVKGEGLLGLPRQFLEGGARSVLMTTWKVDDRFASELMPAFYGYYLGQGRSKAEALWQAKRDVLNQVNEQGGAYHQHPFYWASFVLYGDPGREHSPNWLVWLLLALVVLSTGFVWLRRRGSL